MDPNHWNTYNFQYGTAQGGLTPTHPSLGLSLSHGLQGTHSSISGRSMSGIPSVNYSGLSMPLLETMTPLSTSIQPQQAHKSMSLGEASQLVFDPQGRVSGEQLSPSLNRYDAGSKVLRTEGLSRNQLLEAARVWGGTNFSASPSLYNQYSAIIPDMGMSVSSASLSPSPSNFTSSKSTQPIMQEPPPAHSSNMSRVSSCQRTQHMGDLIYSRNSESLNPSSQSNLGSSYSSVLVKDVHNNNNQQQNVLHHRQTPAQTPQPHGYLSSHRENEMLSSGTATPHQQLYGSYANLAGVDSQDFTSSHMSTNDIAYEAVSPAAPVQQENTTTSHMENSSFSVVQFPEFTNLAPEHAQALVDKFQENEFRMKLDPMRNQQSTQDALSFQQGGLRLDTKPNKDTSHIHALQMNQQSSVFPNIQQSSNITHPSSPHLIPHSGSLTMTSMQQQLQTRPTVQAPADSTTKPKRVRNRKKKDVALTTTTTPTPMTNPKTKSISHSSPDNIHQRHISNLSMPPSSQISTLSLPHSPHIAHDSHHQQRYSSNNQFIIRDAQRTQTPSMPKNYSMNEHQGYTHSPSPVPSPKIQNNPSVLMPPDYSMSSRVHNEKTSTTYKQQHRKPKDPPTPSPNITNQSENQPLYLSNIPDNQMNLQGYSDPNTLMNLSGHSESHIQSNHHVSGHVSRLDNFSSVPPSHPSQHSLANSMSSINHQLSPQETISAGNKLHASNQYMGNADILTMQQSVSDSRQANVSHTSSSPLQPQQSMVMNHTQNFEHRGTPVVIDNQDPSHQFQVDFSGQPFLEQLVSAQNPNYTQDNTAQNENVMIAPLVHPDNVDIKHEQNDETQFRPTYHGETVHEILPVGSLVSELNVDEMSFNPNTYDSQGSMNPSSYSELAQVPVKEEAMTLTFVPPIMDDEEFYHLSKLEPVVAIKTEPEVSVFNNAKKDSFQNSFLSYLQGNKQETLSSVSSAAITKKPQLPKYIPEPRRPRPVVSVLSKDPILLSDSEDASFVSAQGKDFLSTLSDNDNSSQKSESDKEGYTVQRTSELAMKITLSKKKGKISTLGESTLLLHNKLQMEDKVKLKKKKGKYDSDEEELPAVHKAKPGHPPKREPTPPPARTSIGRKAKDRSLEKIKKKKLDSSEFQFNFKGKYAESGSSSEDEIFPVKGTPIEADKDYDSDKDPVWMPFDQDLKAGYDMVEKKKKTKRIRLRAPIRGPPSTTPPIPKNVLDPVTGTMRLSSSIIKPSTSTVPSKDVQAVDQEDRTYEIGQYLIEKKDLQNYDNYPIWRLEQGSMIHKYELVIREGIVRHRATGAYSTWMKSMHNLFKPVKVNELVVKGKGDSVLVQVLEEFQPKMPTDGKLIEQYEDDPLVEPFNIYLQVFISQALEPTFLKAILDIGESFYLDPLNEIDNLVDERVNHLASIARWKESFKDVLHRCPLMKEIDRPNLKQACQACENSSPPTIKSVLLSGFPYDRRLLTNMEEAGSDAAVEFMIGKLAAHYVRPYHSLYHFKYWLRTRCEAKVKIMKESNKAEKLSGENILDKCLENRIWVLQLFDNFKKLLSFESDPVR